MHFLEISRGYDLFRNTKQRVYFIHEKLKIFIILNTISSKIVLLNILERLLQKIEVKIGI